MNYQEQGLVFDCVADSLVGVVAVPERPKVTGVLIIVGGPQYRIGSHRQFVLISRYLATLGIACMRFDNRSMGDATGDDRDSGHRVLDVLRCPQHPVPDLRP